MSFFLFPFPFGFSLWVWMLALADHRSSRASRIAHSSSRMCSSNSGSTDSLWRWAFSRDPEFLDSPLVRDRRLAVSFFQRSRIPWLTASKRPKIGGESFMIARQIPKTWPLHLYSAWLMFLDDEMITFLCSWILSFIIPFIGENPKVNKEIWESREMS